MSEAEFEPSLILAARRSLTKNWPAGAIFRLKKLETK